MVPLLRDASALHTGGCESLAALLSWRIVQTPIGLVLTPPVAAALLRCTSAPQYALCRRYEIAFEPDLMPHRIEKERKAVLAEMQQAGRGHGSPSLAGLLAVTPDMYFNRRSGCPCVVFEATASWNPRVSADALLRADTDG